ncbi:hypothetical protein [Telluribacter humicola]|uniref:hypothetical protein n=1 Tax=Telluribacter humicola TaxID=1720261 RepID=UPI00286E5D4B|nr:hypothetical protein [Telluribacter humicola]
MENFRDSDRDYKSTSHDSNFDHETGTITGVFRDKDDAERAYQSLIDMGYSRDEISVLMSNDTRDTHFKGVDKEDRSELGNKAMEKAGIGSAIGGTAGAIIGAIAAIGTAVAIPGLGLVVAGPIVAGLTGAGAGGLTGGIIGALVGSGIPKERAEVYENSIKEGGIVVGVQPRSREEGMKISDTWRSYRGENIHTGWDSGSWSTTGNTSTTGSTGYSGNTGTTGTSDRDRYGSTDSDRFGTTDRDKDRY